MFFNTNRNKIIETHLEVVLSESLIKENYNIM